MLIKVKTIPKAKNNLIKEENGGYKAWVTAPPIEGKANKALINLLSSHLKIKKSQIKIIKGEKSKNKIIEI